MEILSKSNTRFEIDNGGWRRMNAGREQYELVREAVANAFDQSDVTVVKVNLSMHDHQGVVVVVEDNSPRGIADPALVSTVFMTDKQDSPAKRGRKGRGIKELIAAASHATVDTVGFRVEFADGRTVSKTDRKSGTRIYAHVLEWDEDSLADTLRYLQRIIPPTGVDLIVNDLAVKARMTRCVFSAYLETQIIVDGVQQDTYHEATVNIVNLAKGEREGWIYEMGIPVEPIQTKFHIDVQQRIPLNDARNSVNSAYVNGIYGRCLEKLMPSLSRGALKQEWAVAGITYVSTDTKQAFVRKMFGDVKAAVIKSHNSVANDVVKQHGMQVIDTNGLPWPIQNALTYSVKTADVVAAEIDRNDFGRPIPAYVADPRGKTTAFIKYLACEILGHDVDVQFFEREQIFTGKIKLADYSKETATIRLNTKVGFDFDNPLNSYLMSVICHEFAHDYSREHDDIFQNKVEDLSGKIACIMFNNRQIINALLGPRRKAAGTRHA